MFEIGDAVVHRHRVCEVASVREAYFEGRDYFELRVVFEKSLKLFVAVDDAQPPAVRPVMDKAQALAFLDSIPETKTLDTSGLVESGATSHFAERQVKDAYERCMRECNPECLVSVMKAAFGRMREREVLGKRPTPVDEKFFKLTESLLCDELSVSLGVSREEASVRIAERLRA